MATSQTPVTKEDQTNYFTTNVRNLISNATMWHTDETGAGGLVERDLGTTRASWGSFTSFIGGGKDPGGPDVSVLTESAITASVLVNSFQAWARQYTRVRNFRFIRTGNLEPTVDRTRVTHMTNSYLQSEEYTDINNTSIQNNIVQGANITAANFNAFVNALYTKWNSQKNNTTSYSFDYCHSNCHSSCHSSTRWRR